MELNKLVSVVIPAYNAENSIKDCLNAAMAQTYQNIEVVVVDDGSDDNTCEVCKTFVAKDNRIKLVTQKNKGPSAARNAGISHATGDYIVFWDSDDYPEPDLVESFMEAYKDWNAQTVSLVVCGMFFDNEYYKRVDDEIIILEHDQAYVEGESYLLLRSMAAVLAYLKLFNFVTNKCYDLKLIKSKGITFDENVRIGEDLKFNLDYLDNYPGSIGMINRPLYHYVKRTGDNLSISYHEGDIEDTKTIYRRFIEWEGKQQGATEDNVLVVKSIFLTDWLRRLASMLEAQRSKEEIWQFRSKARRELSDKEFQKLLTEVYDAGKISILRYLCLKTRRFELFYFFRRLYQIIKG